MATKKKAVQNPKDLLADIAKKIAVYRFENKLSVDELSEKAKVSNVLLGNLEKNNLDNISLKKLLDIANAIDLKVELWILPK